MEVDFGFYFKPIPTKNIALKTQLFLSLIFIQLLILIHEPSIRFSL